MNGEKAESRPVLIAGGGIGGLSVALTLHQIGVPYFVFESVKQVQALGVGINLQPNAVRELYDLGFNQGQLDTVGIPVQEWALVGPDGHVALLGDAAHVMYPAGSNGASQAIVDARVLGAALLQHGVSRDALESYNDKLCDDIFRLVLRNRGSGPFGILRIFEERCGGSFNDISEVVSPEEMEAYMAQYKKAAGFSKEALNNSPQTIALNRRAKDSDRHGQNQT